MHQQTRKSRAQRLLEDFSELTSLEQSKEMLHAKGHILLAEHSQSYLLLSCLEDEMNGKVGGGTRCYCLVGRAAPFSFPPIDPIPTHPPTYQPPHDSASA